MSSPPVVLGLWPLAGITTVGVRASDAIETIEAAADGGIQTFDTAFSYGYEGEMDTVLGSFLRGRTDRFSVIGKVGQRWTGDRKRIVDASQETLIRDAETSLKRLGIGQFDLLMLHSPDPTIPIQRSAEALERLRGRGICRKLGVCNVTVDQYREFRDTAGCEAIQCPLNLLQRSSLDQLIPACRNDGCDVYVFWTLMKGLLAGHISRDHSFAEGDPRPSYEIYQGPQRDRAHELLDQLGKLSASSGLTIAQLSIGWAVSQPGVTAALVGARTADQAREIASTKVLEPGMLRSIESLF